MKKSLFVIIAGMLYATGYSQNVAINEDGSLPHNSAILDVKSSSKGILIPRLTTIQRNGLMQVDGLLVYDTDTKSFWYSDGLAWINMAMAAGWTLNGNSGTIDGVHYIGTNDNTPLNFKINGGRAGRIDALLHNVSWGYLAFGSTTSGTDNAAIGFQALFSATTGKQNVAIGSSALQQLTTGYGNIAIGFSSLQNNAANYNVGIGVNTLQYTSTGSNNVALGSYALQQNTTGLGNTAVGDNSMLTNRTGRSNAAFGWTALGTNTSGNNNTGIGSGSLYQNTTGGSNTAVGSDAIRFNSLGSFNSGLGLQALMNSSGSGNTALGAQALLGTTSGSGNTAVGWKADVTTGTLNNATAIGFNAKVSKDNTMVLGGTGTDAVSVAIGATGTDASAVLDISSSNKGLLVPRLNRTSIVNPAEGLLVYDINDKGYYYFDGTIWKSSIDRVGWALDGNDATPSSYIGTRNNEPLRLQSGSMSAGFVDPIKNNAFWGKLAGNLNATGINNSAIGSYALGSIINGNNNTATGNYALYSTQSGNNNTAIGNRSLYSNISGDNNTAIGNLALIGNTIGSQNAALGYQSLYNTTSGSMNSGFGQGALQTNVLGNANTALGAGADVLTGGLTNATAIGANAVVDADNKIRLGNTAVTTVESYGSFYTRGQYYAWNGTAYVPVISGWSLSGNANTTGATYLGTSDDQPLRFRINNTAAGLIDRVRGSSFFGYLSGSSVTTNADNNTALGYNSLTATTDGDNNTAIGYSAISGNTTGFNNTGVGVQALQLNTTGTGNVAVGASALRNNTTGTSNTAIGFNAGPLAANPGLTNTTAIGSNAVVSTSNTIQIGNGSVTDVYFGNGSTTRLHAFTTITTSDTRFKENIRDDVPGLAFITRLRPVTYSYDLDKLESFRSNSLSGTINPRPAGFNPGSIERHSGFLAQDVEKVLDGIDFDFDGLHRPAGTNDAYGLSYAQFVVPLVKAVQEQQAIIASQNTKISQQEKKLKALEAQIVELKQLFSTSNSK